MRLFFVFLIGVFVLSVNNGCGERDKEIDYNYKEYDELVRENSFQGKIIAAFYMAPDSVVLAKGGEAAAGAVLGGGTSALLGFGPLGIVIGAGIGASAAGVSRIRVREERLFVMAVREDSMNAAADTFYFERL